MKNENQVKANKEVWISFIDETGSSVEGFFKLLEQNSNYVKIESGKNIFTIPYHKINKIKEKK